MSKRRCFFAAVILAIGMYALSTSLTQRAFAQEIPEEPNHEPTAAYKWLGIMLEVSAREVEEIGARPTILSRQMAITATAMYDAWAAYDDKAVGTILGGQLRRPPEERTIENKEQAIAFAMYRACLDQFPQFEGYLTEQMEEMGFDPSDKSEDLSTPQGIGNHVSRLLIEYRHRDGANQLGNEQGSNGEPYSDYTMYRVVNPNHKVIDPDRWQRLPFTYDDGTVQYPDFLTPHWYRVKPFALASADQFRPGPPPLYGSEQLKQEVDECIAFNASLTPEQKAIVEFMRDGPRSTAQSGHWLKFSQVVSRRDKNDLDTDVKLFFTIANIEMDAFIAAWDSKRFYDSSRPWTLVRHLYAGKTIKGWAGPGKGVTDIPAEQWHPYSPASFVTPPFPGYVSGHSCASGAAAEALKLFTGSDNCRFVEKRLAGELTEAGFTCREMQQLDGRPLAEIVGDEHASCDILLPLPTFSSAAEMAGISRVMGGYHIQADNIAGLKLGRDVARYSWPKYQAYFNGTATVEHGAHPRGTR